MASVGRDMILRAVGVARPAARCPMCGTRRLDVAVPRAAVAEEIALREWFHYRRFARPLDPADLHDRVNLMHGDPADLLFCDGCSIAVRDDGSDYSSRYA